MAGNSVDALELEGVGHRIFKVGTNGRVVAHADDQHALEALAGIGGTLYAGYQLGALATCPAPRRPAGQP